MGRDRARRDGPGGPVGLAVVDKEAGCTSHDVVARCRRIFGERRVGHAGTLDPDATGVLLVGVGNLTRVLRFLTGLGKTYEAEIVLGTATTTLDASGDVVGQWDMGLVTVDDVRRAAASLTGRIEQVPPMVSALKVGGRRLHELARAGVEVERRPRPVTVDRFEVFPGTAAHRFRAVIECSAGTYVRSLAADLGTALGGGAHVGGLCRTRVGSFGRDEAHRIADLSVENLLTPVEAVRDMARVDVDEATAARVLHGGDLDRARLGAHGPGPWALVDPAGGLVAVYEAADAGRMVAACVLAAT